MSEKISTFGERLKNSVPEGMSQKEFSKQIGVSLATFGNWVAGTNEPKLSSLVSISRISGVDFNWLATGQEPSDVLMSDRVFVKRFAVHGSGGSGGHVEGNEELSPIGFDRLWLKTHIGVPVDQLSVITLKGDSMEPDIQDGSLCLIHHVIERVADDGIYVLWVDGQLFIKRVQKQIGGGLILSSSNPAYSPQTISDPEAVGLLVQGQVKWCGRRY